MKATTKTELLRDIANIEGICEVITDQNEQDNLLAVTSIAQLHFGIELITEGDVSEIGAVVLLSFKNN